MSGGNITPVGMKSRQWTTIPTAPWQHWKEKSEVPIQLQTSPTSLRTGSTFLRCRRDELRVPRRQARVVLSSSLWVCLVPSTPRIQLPFTRLSRGTGSPAREVVGHRTGEPAQLMDGSVSLQKAWAAPDFILARDLSGPRDVQAVGRFGGRGS